MNWYDWNLKGHLRCSKLIHRRRDWSAWIDTIETPAHSSNHFRYNLVGIDLHELIRLKLINPFAIANEFQWSGLICMNWYDWNDFAGKPSFSWILRRDWSAWIDTIETWHLLQVTVPILRRRDWSAWIDTIETSSSIVFTRYKSKRSGLICMNWYDWNCINVWISSPIH